MHPLPNADPSPACVPAPVASLRWDIFCRVIDNFGDIGVCWRLAADLATRAQQVRLWVDDTSALHWMAPGALEGAFNGVEVLRWEQSQSPQVLEQLPPADVWVETFGCEIAPEFIAYRAESTRATGQKLSEKPVWLNLEHLTAESFAQRNHALPSPVMQGPAAGWTKYFYYPGFTAGTGGLLREPSLASRQAKFDRAKWLARHAIAWQGERLVSLFCYEPAALSDFLQKLREDDAPTLLLVTAGRATNAVRALAALDPAASSAISPALAQQLGALRVVYLPAVTQPEYDELLWACDFNCVRGEDSVVRALWANKPFVWQIYPQDDAAHHAKLEAFLAMLQAGPSLLQFHHVWNETAPPSSQAQLPKLDLVQWQTTVSTTRQRLLQAFDLGTELIQYALKKR